MSLFSRLAIFSVAVKGWHYECVCIIVNSTCCWRTEGNRIRHDMITVISTTQGAGHGAESVLCEMLEAWPGGALGIAAPCESRVLARARQLGYATIPLAAARDSLIRNAYAIRNGLRGVTGISLVHAWSARSFEFAWWLKHCLGVPATGTLHDHPSASFHGAARRQIMRAAANRLDALAVVSRAVEAAVEADAWRMPVSVIHNGLCSCPRRTACPSPAVRIGFLGMYASWKGAATVRNWIEALSACDSPVVWQMYGDAGPGDVGGLQVLAARWPDKVMIKGRRSTEDIFAEIDILVHASTQFDPFPTVLIEAARAGIPCVASSLGGSSEIVEEGKTGFLFDPARPAIGLRALKALVAGKQLRLELGNAARRHYEQSFQAGTMAAGYRAFWDALITNRRGGD